MKKIILLALMAALAVTGLSAEQFRMRSRSGGIIGTAGGGASFPARLTAAQLTSNYSGAFRMPDTSSNGFWLDSGPGIIAYNPNSGRLFASNRLNPGTGDVNRVAELIIPAPVNTSNLALMNRATYGQGIFEPLEATDLSATLATMDFCTAAQRTSGSCQPASLLGMAVTGTELVFSYGIGYDANNDQRRSHWVRSTTLAASTSVRGGDQFSDGTGLDSGLAGNTGFTAGYIGAVPAARQAALGGTLVSGWCCPSIIFRTSYGPALGAFNASAISGTAAIKTWNALVGYSGNHQTLGAWEAAGPNFGIATAVRGVAVIDGTDTVVFAGRHGDTYCYGTGNPDPAKHMTQIPGQPVGEKYCYTLTSDAKANHGYPYHYSLWLYDINDFIKVKAGTINPSTGVSWKAWEVVPYERANITFPVMNAANQEPFISGLAWDPVGRRLFIAQHNVDGTACSLCGLVQVYTVPQP